MENSFKFASLTPKQTHVLLNKGTDKPDVSQTFLEDTPGTFLCRGCGLALFRGEHQFQSSCGWPSFDDQIKGGITIKPDRDGVREEICCQRCDSHLGHVFKGESLTKKNVRHCVNASSIEFVPNREVMDSEEIIVAGGCFWGIEYFLSKEDGVLKVESGYCGGHLENPSYQTVCQGKSGHYEAVRVLFDNNKSSAKTLYKVFFELHTPFAEDGIDFEKPLQYQSAVFVYDQKQEQIAKELIAYLERSTKKVVSTKTLPVTTFWPAEESHQNYYQRQPNLSVCHQRTKRF